jgi:hypothetical protein
MERKTGLSGETRRDRQAGGIDYLGPGSDPGVDCLTGSAALVLSRNRHTTDKNESKCKNE